MICDICGKEDVKIRYVTRSYGKEKDHLTPGENQIFTRVILPWNIPKLDWR
jgi:hypothetical protein